MSSPFADIKAYALKFYGSHWHLAPPAHTWARGDDGEWLDIPARDIVDMVNDLPLLVDLMEGADAACVEWRLDGARPAGAGAICAALQRLRGGTCGACSIVDNPSTPE